MQRSSSVSVYIPAVPSVHGRRRISGKGPLKRRRGRVSYCTTRLSEGSGLVRWLSDERGVEYRNVHTDGSIETEFTATRALSADEVVFDFSSDLTITDIDAERQTEIQSLTKGRSQLVQLTMWVLAERLKGADSLWYPFLKALPERSLSPILWSREELQDYFRGSSIAEEAMKRRKSLLAEWDDLSSQSNTALLPGMTEEAFLDAFSVVLAYAFYLPKAGRFALLPPLLGIQRTGDERTCLLDYDTQTDSLTLTAQRDYKYAAQSSLGGWNEGLECSVGEAVRVFDGRPNDELLLATGAVERANPSDFVPLDFELVPADRLYSAKRQILENLGYQPKQTFPIYLERIPTQLLSFLRLSRIQDANLLTQVSFEEDVVISQMNEYEVLQLVLGECRVRLSQYERNSEEDLKALQGDGLPEKQRLATELLLGEKQILQSCVEIVRSRLAPIRGVPTKSGKFEDPNKDIADMFEAIESIPQAPKKLFDGLISWARGDYDPEWKKRR